MSHQLNPGSMSLAQIRQLISETEKISLGTSSYAAIEKCRSTVEHLCQQEESTYGINTGFGKLAQTRIESSQLEQLQENLVLSHCCGVGQPLEDQVVKLILLLKVMSLARGYSGVRVQTIDALIALFNHNVLPVIPEKGSVGASGDLAPLAHMSAALIGVGQVRLDGQRLPATQGLEQIKMKPIRLGAKEGLALINGTQASTALALSALFAAENLFSAALVTGALSVDAMKGSDAPFDDRLHEVRGHQSQRDVAAVFRKLLDGSQIRQSHLDCDRVQDPYSLRCQPQVMGAVLNSLQHAAEVLRTECNGVSDNPIIFSQDHSAISGGNFHAEPVALVADAMAVAIAEIGALSERRTANLVDANQSGLPAFLVEDAGLNSGFMIAQVTAAALASENKSLAHPASVDSLPTSANQEDHVSMATFAARRLHTMIENTAGILAIELLAAVQGIEFRSSKTSTVLDQVITTVRSIVPRYDHDRYFADDIALATQLISSGKINRFTEFLLPSHAS